METVQPAAGGGLPTGSTVDLGDRVDLKAKLARLQEIIAGLGSVLVAYSGGVDSTLVLKVCYDTLGPSRVLAALGVSESLAAAEREQALETARLIGARVRLVKTDELLDPNYVANPANRCFFCKQELFTKLNAVAAEEGLAAVVDGSNYDDLGDWRPGMQAGAQLGVRRPLVEAELTKADIRALARAFGLPVWDKPASPCLSSRIPYGIPVTVGALRQIERGEAFLKSLGLREVRLRHHDKLARIEARVEDLPILIDPANRERIVAALRELGYVHVTVDLAGYRSGSANEVLRHGRQRPETPAR